MKFHTFSNFFLTFPIDHNVSPMFIYLSIFLYLIEIFAWNDRNLDPDSWRSGNNSPFNYRVQVIQSLDGLVFSILCKMIIHNCVLKSFIICVQFMFMGMNVKRIRVLGLTLEHWNRDVGRSQGVSLAFGVNQSQVNTWRFTIALDWQLCSCCCAQSNLLLCRVQSVI